MAALATMFTVTTYGVWLRGDPRRWVDEGRVLPPDPELEAADRRRLKYAPFVFAPHDLLAIGAKIGHDLIASLSQRILALTVQVWHVHLVVRASEYAPPAIVKCLKDAVRWQLRTGRPIWGAGYDKRYCFDERSLEHRIAYVERHNLAQNLPARPWDFIEALR